MKLRIKALRSLRWNYKRRGVWVWLKGRQKCRGCLGGGRVPLGVTPGLIGLTTSASSFTSQTCSTCEGDGKVRGYQRILFEPRQAFAEQERAAAGAAT